MNRPKKQIDISTTRMMHKARTLKALRRPLLLTRLGILLERATRAFWPLWSWIFSVWTVLSFNLFNQLSIEVAYFAALLLLGGSIVFLVFGIRQFRWPNMSDAADRVDRSIEGRPLTALWDTQAIGDRDPASTMVWQEHISRISRIAASARSVKPDLRISKRDPFGLRFVAATALVVSLLFGAGVGRSSFTEILASDESAAVAAGPIFEGWIEPPRYTGLPSIYLNEVDGTEPLSIPQGSRITLRLYGQTDTLKVEETVSPASRAEAEDESAQDSGFVVTQSGELNILSRGELTKSWQIEMTADNPPMIAVTGPVERSPRGETMLTFRASDDYGVVSGIVSIDLDRAALDRRYGLAQKPEPQETITFDIPMPFNGDTREFTESQAEDLSKHVWAGLPVILKLQGFDDLGQSALSEPEAILLPARRFFDPLAAAIVEQRRDLLWNRTNAKRVSQVLRAVSYYPEDLFDNEKGYLVLRSALRRIEYNTVARSALSDEARDDVAELLWQAALQVEDGDLSGAAVRLKRAQDRLSEALKNGATDEEISKLMAELRRAMQDYMEKLAQEFENNPEQDQADNSERQKITNDKLQQILDRIQELFREGRNEEAQELLEQLRRMMENMQVTHGDPSEGEGQQSLQDLQDTLRQQQQLTDDAFSRLQEQFNGQNQPGELPNNSNPGLGQTENSRRGDNAPPDARELARRQGALRDLLEQQRRGIPDVGGTDEGRDALRRAEREMDEAAEALRGQNFRQALDDQAQALDELRRGIENLGQELARNQNHNVGRQGDQAGAPDPNSNRDPLGRQSGTMGRVESSDNLMSDGDRYMRSRELMEEIRRRSGEKYRPKIELEYLERLLDRF